MNPHDLIPQALRPWAWPVAQLPHGAVVGIAYIRPDLATLMLGLNIDRNRPIRPNSIKQYADDMSAGRWKLTHQGIAFNRDGQLIDGQHRLHAIVRAGATIPIHVTFGAENFDAIDMGAARRVQDAARIVGVYGTQQDYATLRAMLFGPNSWGARLTPSLMLAAMAEAEGVISTIAAQCGGGRTHRLAPSYLRGAAARAWYHTTPERIARFFSILFDREAAGPGDSAVMRIRAHLIDCGGRGQPRTFQAGYQKVQRGIRAFLDGEPLQILRPCREDLFPLPPSLARFAPVGWRVAADQESAETEVTQ
jgi:hypothetical protein